MARRKKTDTTDIFLYGAIGVASGFAINYIQNFFLWYSFRKESWNLYKKGLEQFGKPFALWWEIQKTYIDVQNDKLTEEEANRTVALLIEDPEYSGITDKQVLEAEAWYKENCKWLNKGSYFRQRYAISNYALVIAGLLPFILTIKSKSLKYILYGGAVSGLYNAVKYNVKQFDIYKLQKANKLYVDIAKVIDKDFVAEFNSGTGWAGYILWSIFDLSEQKTDG